MRYWIDTLALRAWWLTRRYALKRIQRSFPGEYDDAHIVWRQYARLDRQLGGPAWNTRGLPDDLALHDAADSLLGEQS